MRFGAVPGPLSLSRNFPAFVRWLADNGFECVDIRSVNAEEKAAAEAVGLTIGTFSAGSLNRALDADPGKRKGAVEALTAELRQAAALGLKTWFVCFVPMDKLAPRAATFEIWKSFFPGIVELCESLDLRIAMEPYPGPPPAYPTIGCTPEMWRAMFQVCPSKVFGLCYDPSHMARLGVDYVRALKEFGDRVHHVHAKDCAFLQEEQYLQGRLTRTFGPPPLKFSEGWWRYCIPGAGVVDWREVLTGLSMAGKADVCLSVELEDHFYAASDERNQAGLLAARDYICSVWR